MEITKQIREAAERAAFEIMKALQSTKSWDGEYMTQGDFAEIILNNFEQATF